MSSQIDVKIEHVWIGYGENNRISQRYELNVHLLDKMIWVETYWQSLVYLRPNIGDAWYLRWFAEECSSYRYNHVEPKEPSNVRMDQDEPTPDVVSRRCYHNRGFPTYIQVSSLDILRKTDSRGEIPYLPHKEAFSSSEVWDLVRLRTIERSP